MTTSFYKLLRGRHRQFGKTYFSDDPKNNIVESKIDLVERCGKDKFEYCEGPPPTVEPIDDGLENLSLKDLQVQADGLGLDGASLKDKKKALKVIREALDNG